MLRIYLGDLTHTTITISNDSFPLNVGMIAAYAKKFYPEADIRIFKYPEKLLDAINEAPPQILGLSNYPWNFHLDESFFRYVKRCDSKTITVMGGPNMPYDSPEQEKILLKLQGEVDFYAMFEGETAFREVLDSAVANDFDIEKMKSSGVTGSLHIRNGRLAEFRPIPRAKGIDNYPSPYLAGIMDEFFDGKLSPMIETHRGCPFSCTYCHEGDANYNSVSRFGMERLNSEIEMISSKIGSKVSNFLIADPNFGMFGRDIEIAKKISEAYKKHGYPKTVFATTAKNRKENLIKISKILGDVAMPVWMSVQSMTEEVLANIKRKNIRIADMIAIQNELADDLNTTKSELIMCLPGETFKSHVESLVELMKLKIDQIVTYQLMLVNGSEIKSADLAQNRFGFVKKFRVLPRSFSDLNGPGLSIETEDIVVATKDFSFEEYLKARELHLLTAIFYNGMAFKGFFKLIDEFGLNLRGFVFTLLDLFISDEKLRPLTNNFLRETKEELYESEKKLLEHYSKPSNYEKLVQGKSGGNLLQIYASTGYMEHGSSLLDILHNAVKAVAPDNPGFAEKIEDVTAFYRLSLENFLNPEREQIISKGSFSYDVSKWIDGKVSMDEYRYENRVEIEFFTPADQFEMVENYLERYGRNSQAFGKILTRLWIVDMYRKAKPLGERGGSVPLSGAIKRIER